MMSITLDWWPLVRIERNLRSITGSLSAGLGGTPAELAVYPMEVVPTFFTNRTVGNKIVS